jgi:hypothetical protein
MKLTIICYSYHISSPYWKKEIDEEKIKQICEYLNSYPFTGPEGASFGFWNCGVLDKYLYGYFIQHIIEDIEHIDSMKNRIPAKVINAIKYPFFINFLESRIVIQHRKVKGTESPDKIVGKFMGLYDMVMVKNNNEIMIGNHFDREKHGFDRDFVVEKFFNVNSRVVELKASDFIEKNVRTEFSWFNPHPPTADVLIKEGELIIQNVDSVEMKAREGGNLRKVPNARYYIESSENPSIMVKEGEINKKYLPKREAEIRISIENSDNMNEEGFNDFIRKVSEAITGEVVQRAMDNIEQNLLYNQVVENNE